MRWLSVVLILVAAGAACGGGSPKKVVYPTGFIPSPIAGTINFDNIPKVKGTVHTTASGLRYVDEKTGSGPIPKAGQHATVKYTGWLVFGTSITGDKPVTSSYLVGSGETLKGIDEAVRSMHVGGQRRVLLPPSLGYGDAGLGSGIVVTVPPKSNLVYDLQLLSVR